MWNHVGPQLRPLRPGASLAGTFTHLSMTVFVGRSVKDKPATPCCEKQRQDRVLARFAALSRQGLTHTHTLSYCLSLSLSLLVCSFLFSLKAGRWPRAITKMRQLRTKWGSVVKNWGKIVIFTGLLRPLRTKWGSIVKNGRKIVICLVPKRVPRHNRTCW